jgi:flagellar biosynthesis protein FlhG
MTMADQAQRLREIVAGSKSGGGENDLDLSARRGHEDVLSSPSARVLTVTSGKGGVGKSNVAVNLGISLAKQGQRVAVIDMDLGTANVNVITDVSPTHNLFDVFKKRKDLSEIVERGPEGVLIVAGASGKDELANLGEAECQRFLSQLSQLDEAVDVIIMDTAAGISRSVMHFVRGADQTLLVTTPEPTAITDAYALVKASVRRDPKPRFKLVVNRADSIMEARKVADKVERVGREFLDVSLDVLGYMVEDNAVRKAVRRRRPFLLDAPEARASQCVDHLSKRLMNPEEDLEPKGVKNLFQTMMDWVN